MRKGFRWGSLKDRDHCGDLGVDNIKMRFKQMGWDGANWTEESHNMWGISLVMQSKESQFSKMTVVCAGEVSGVFAVLMVTGHFATGCKVC